jgi:hypothetical protein
MEEMVCWGLFCFALRPGATASVHMFFTIVQTEKRPGNWPCRLGNWTGSLKDCFSGGKSDGVTGYVVWETGQES